MGTEMTTLCSRVQWVFKSACEYINKKHSAQIKTAIMRLTEPEDICKQLSYCAPDFYDAQQMGGHPSVAEAVLVVLVAIQEEEDGHTMDMPYHNFRHRTQEALMVDNMVFIQHLDHIRCLHNHHTLLTTMEVTIHLVTLFHIRVYQVQHHHHQYLVEKQPNVCVK